MTGASMWHGWHQSAQKSTSTGSCAERSSTRCWKSASVTSIGLAIALEFSDAGSSGPRYPSRTDARSITTGCNGVPASPLAGSPSSPMASTTSWPLTTRPSSA